MVDKRAWTTKKYPSVAGSIRPSHVRTASPSQRGPSARISYLNDSRPIPDRGDRGLSLLRFSLHSVSPVDFELTLGFGNNRSRYVRNRNTGKRSLAVKLCCVTAIIMPATHEIYSASNLSTHCRQHWNYSWWNEIRAYWCLKCNNSCYKLFSYSEGELQNANKTENHFPVLGKQD